MLLRNRDLNVQKNVEQQEQEEQQRLKGDEKTHLGTINKVTAISKTKVAAIKRPTANPIIHNAQKKESADEPQCKRTRASKMATTTSLLSLSNLHLPNFSQALCINTTSKKSRSSQQQSIAKVSQLNLPWHRKEVVHHPQVSTTTITYQFDVETAKDLTAVADYAQDIFTYYKNRESHFIVSDYMERHPEVKPLMRAKLVDFLVEIQEAMELNHETLYLAVKLFDLFMDRTKRVIRPQKTLQLIGCAAIFIASKFDERAPPLVDDLIYLADDMFTHEELISMERELLVTVDFDLGAPLSYRFLRRLARITKTDMITLTLARYVLELSLMSLRFCRTSESLMAAACLLLAKRIKAKPQDRDNDVHWNADVQNSCGYTLAEVEPVMWALNRLLEQRHIQFPDFLTSYKKYSYENFFEVAKCTPLDNKHRENSLS